MALGRAGNPNSTTYRATQLVEADAVSTCWKGEAEPQSGRRRRHHVPRHSHTKCSRRPIQTLIAVGILELTSGSTTTVEKSTTYKITPRTTKTRPFGNGSATTGVGSKCTIFLHIRRNSMQPNQFGNTLENLAHTTNTLPAMMKYLERLCESSAVFSVDHHKFKVTLRHFCDDDVRLIMSLRIERSCACVLRSGAKLTDRGQVVARMR